MMATHSDQKPTLLVCGDSIFDNTPYVQPGEADVRRHLSRMAPGWAVDFRAVDGSVSADVTSDQLDHSASYDAIALSVGGNDALQHINRLMDPDGVTFLKHALDLAGIQSRFREDYRRTVQSVRSMTERLLVATIYRPRFHLDGYPAQMLPAIDPLLSIFNDVIQEEARKVDAELLDLRLFCITDADFANPIEPSEEGGRKIATGIVEWLGPTL